MTSHIVIVESPAKATTINKYLGSQYTVLASYGHVRDLPSKDGSVDTANRFNMHWQLDARGKKVVTDIAKAVRKADTVILATDPDREGEAISWHLHQVLQEQGVLKPHHTVQRVVFNEITKTAIQTAMANPRQIDQPLVEAYLARRALDYLVGFNLSPVLWRKLPGSRSAGRVQSVALRIICDREMEIEAFKTQEYWSLQAQLQHQQSTPFWANLVQWQGNKLDKLSIGTGADAQQAQQAIEGNTPYVVVSVDKKQVQRQPYGPFITSTLQQEASRKLGFSVTRTMQTAQKLYEGVSIGSETVGLITYMRTDGMNLAQDAVTSIRGLIGKQFGDRYVPDKPKIYKTKAKNAQEAHEAIRPTDIRRTPASMRGYLNDDQARLYELIWRRTLACQMANAVLEQCSIPITPQAPNTGVMLKATGSVVVFDGFLAAYQESHDDAPSNDTADSTEAKLPPLQAGDVLQLNTVLTKQHFTQPPPRFSEASLVKRLEELGIGRPSTYASIIKVLQDRQYVRMEQRRFIPEDRGRLVTAFLIEFFSRYVGYDFTADLEEQLDAISNGSQAFLQVLNTFWHDFTANVQATQDLKVGDVLTHLDAVLGQHFFPAETEEAREQARHCPSCGDGRLGLKLGKFGAFIGCSNYPTCKYTRQLDASSEGEGSAEGAMLDAGPVELGIDAATQKQITLNKGPYGYYVQLGEEEEIPPPAGSRAKKPKKVKPRRASLPEGLKPDQVSMEVALKLLTLPRSLGQDADGTEIIANTGRYGPYLQLGTTFVSIKAPDDVYTIELLRAIEVINTSGKRGTPLGIYQGTPVSLHKGRWGYYLNYGKAKVFLPKGTEATSVTLAFVEPLLEAHNAKAPATKATKTSKTTKTTSKASSSRTKTSPTHTIKASTTAKRRAGATTSKASTTKRRTKATEG